MKTPQDEARGFPYTPGGPMITGSMTTAGLSSLAIVKAMLLIKRATIVPKKPILEDDRPVTTPSGGR